jgi:hypothetical protein
LDLKIENKEGLKEEIKFNDDLYDNTETAFGGILNTMFEYIEYNV